MMVKLVCLFCVYTDSLVYYNHAPSMVNNYTQCHYIAVGFATVGFNAGDMENFATVPGSNTANVINISSTSNVGIPGMWMFQVNGVQITGIQPEPLVLGCYNSYAWYLI